MREKSGWGAASSQYVRSQLDQDLTVDVCVIGLGASGLAAITRASEAGMSVAGIDRFGVATGAAGRNGGFLLAGLAIPFYEALGVLGDTRAVAWYQHTLNEQGDVFGQLGADAWKVGSFRVGTSEKELEHLNHEATVLREHGFEAVAHVSTAGEGIFKAHDGGFNPVARCNAMAKRANDLGAQLYGDTPELFVEPGIVSTPRATIRAKFVVAAIDGRLSQVFPVLSRRVTNTRLQMLSTEPISERVIECPTYARWEYDYWQQIPSGEVFLGGFRDEFELDERSASETSSSPVQSRLEAFLREDLGIDAAITNRWAGVVGYSDNGLPIVEQVMSNVIAIGSYNGLGNLNGTLCGKAAIDHINGNDDLWKVFTSEHAE